MFLQAVSFLWLLFLHYEAYLNPLSEVAGLRSFEENNMVANAEYISQFVRLLQDHWNSITPTRFFFPYKLIPKFLFLQRVLEESIEDNPLTALQIPTSFCWMIKVFWMVVASGPVHSEQMWSEFF